MPPSPIVGLEIGTSKVVALVGEVREDGHVMITGIGECPSSGVRKGQIIDASNVSMCVDSVLQTAEERSDVSIREVLLAVSGAHIQGAVHSGMVPVYEPEGGISEEDIEEVIDVARRLNLPPDRLVLHSISQHFKIDGHHRVLRPTGMVGAQLSLEMLILHGVRNRLNDAINIVDRHKIQVQDTAISGLCSALAVLTPEQRKSGAIVIDLGGGTTDYVAYAEGVVADVGVLGLGGDHITNDIGIAFSIPTTQAEDLKQEDGSAMVESTRNSARVSLPAEGGFPGRTVTVKALRTVIHLRVKEILETVKERLDRRELFHHIGAGIVITGGSANLNGITTLVEQVFGLPCVVGTPRNVTGLATAAAAPEYATATGLVQYGFRSSKDQESSVALGGWFKKVLRR